MVSTLAPPDGRGRETLGSRWPNSDSGKAILHELAQQHAVAAECLRQIEKIAMHKVKHLLQMTTSVGPSRLNKKQRRWVQF